jgi:hypothetical protein
MKKYLLLPLAVISLSAGSFIFNACQKEQRETQTKQKEKTPATPKTCARPIFADKVVDTHCSQGSPCSLAMIPATNRNRIKWRVGTPCPGSPNWVGTTYYTLYKYNGTQYDKVATFNCTNPNMWYASSVLTNTSTFIIVSNNFSTVFPATIVEDMYGYLYDTSGGPLSYSDSWKFVTGNTAGTVNCINKDPIDL